MIDDLIDAARDGAPSDDWNLTSPSFFADGNPEELYARLRRDDPVHWTQGRLSRGFWSITRYKEAQQVYANDNRTFSIQQSGNVLPPHPDFEDPANAEALRLTREAPISRRWTASRTPSCGGRFPKCSGCRASTSSRIWSAG